MRISRARRRASARSPRRRALLSRAFDLPVGGIGGPERSPRVLRDQFLLDEFVELMQVNVTEDRRYHAALRTAAERFVIFPVFQVPGFQHVPDKPQEPLVMDFLRQYPEKDLMVKDPKQSEMSPSINHVVPVQVLCISRSAV